MSRFVLYPENNLVLIGMPGAGKSTVGVLLAKESSRAFLDTDVVIQSHEGRRLYAIQQEEGMDAFVALEERYILDLRLRGHVIATGGSVVFSERAMAHLAKGSVVIYLRLPLPDLEARLGNLQERGVVMRPGQSLAQVYAHRTPLYEKYANRIVDCGGKGMEAVVKEIKTLLNAKGD